MKGFVVFLAGAAALAGAAVLCGFSARPVASDQVALLEEIRWLAAAEWHRQNPAERRGDCDFTTCVRGHMQDHAKAVAVWKSPEAQKRRAEEAEKNEREFEAYKERRRAKLESEHAKLFKHPRLDDCDPHSVIGPCKEREAKWIEQKLLEEREK